MVEIFDVLDVPEPDPKKAFESVIAASGVEIDGWRPENCVKGIFEPSGKAATPGVPEIPVAEGGLREGDGQTLFPLMRALSMLCWVAARGFGRLGRLSLDSSNASVTRFHLKTAALMVRHW